MVGFTDIQILHLFHINMHPASAKYNAAKFDSAKN